MNTVSLRWVFFFLQFCCALPMFHKRARTQDSSRDPAKRFRQNLSDLFLGNEVSGARAQSLFSDAELEGAQHVSDLAAAGARGSLAGNAGRDLTRKLLRGKGWPSLYKAQLRVWDVHNQREVTTAMPMLLPHELIAALAKHNSLESLLVRDGLTKDCREHLQQAEGKLQKASLLGLGLWCDGVPYNWDRSQSIEVVSLSLPGLCSSGAQLRLPLFGINKKYLFTNATYDDLFTVLSWSFRCLAVGHHPAARHDGAARCQEASCCWQRNRSSRSSTRNPRRLGHDEASVSIPVVESKRWHLLAL